VIVRFLHLLALGYSVGAIVFFSFVVAPTLFQVLGREQAGDVLAVIFPRYYQLGIAAAAVALATAMTLRRRGPAGGWWTGSCVALALGLAATLWAGVVVEPRARQLRVEMHAAGTGAPASEEFGRVHRLAVTLNGGALVAGLVALGCSAAALRP
jgi:hypothetical protein